jgi:hypothetical protein
VILQVIITSVDGITSLKISVAFVRGRVQDDQELAKRAMSKCESHSHVVLQLRLFPQLKDDEPENFIFQQDDAPPYWHNGIRDWLNVTVHDRWIGHKEPNDRACFAWPPRSPNLTPCDFYLWGFIKDRMHVTPIPADLPELRNRIEAAVATITQQTLINVWEELAICLDV